MVHSLCFARLNLEGYTPGLRAGLPSQRLAMATCHLETSFLHSEGDSTGAIVDSGQRPGLESQFHHLPAGDFKQMPKCFCAQFPQP